MDLKMVLKKVGLSKLARIMAVSLEQNLTLSWEQYLSIDGWTVAKRDYWMVG